MPYFDINPYRQRPVWLAYMGLAVLVSVCAFVVILALMAS
jgi:hypothetical protein